ELGLDRGEIGYWSPLGIEWAGCRSVRSDRAGRRGAGGRCDAEFRKRTQRILRAAGGADQQQHAVDETERASRLPELAEALARCKVEGAEVDAAADRERRPQRQRERGRQHPL